MKFSISKKEATKADVGRKKVKMSGKD